MRFNAAKTDLVVSYAKVREYTKELFYERERMYVCVSECVCALLATTMNSFNRT